MRYWKLILPSDQVTSFVRADRVPALADSDELCVQLWQQQWAVEAREAGATARVVGRCGVLVVSGGGVCVCACVRACVRACV